MPLPLPSSVLALARRINWTWAVVPLGFGLSWMASHYAQQVNEREARHRFETAARDARHSVETELRTYTQAIYGLRALFSANPQVTRQEFDHYVGVLEPQSRLPAFAALTFARYVPAAQRAGFEQHIRHDDSLPSGPIAGFTIRAPESLPYHFVIDYVYPPEPVHESTIGIDITAEAVRRPALVQQVETGLLTSSGVPITALSRRLNSNLLPMRVMAYRQGAPLATAEDRWRAVVGSVGAAFYVRVLFDRALKESAPQLRLRVYDIGSTADPVDLDTGRGVLIYDNSRPDGYLYEQGTVTHGARFEQTLLINWATRRWAMQFSADEGFSRPADGGLPWLLLGGGMVATLLLLAWLQALARSRSHAEAARRAQSNFLGHMSHELRTPLNGILGYAQLLEMGGNLSAAQASGVRTIKASGDHLLSLIDDLLDIARIEAGRLDLHVGEVALAPFLQGVADIVRVRAAEKGIDFEHRPDPMLPPVVRADERRLRQVLLNLLGNAVKFTDRGCVRFHVTRIGLPGAEPGARVRFEIEDSGVGIGAPQLERLFRPFEQAGEAGRRRGGTGLGLVISRELVRRMGGEIEVRSTPGEGSTFAFELVLPVAAAEAATIPAPDGSSNHGHLS
jgi:signal transduction histidine kinase